MPVAAIRVLEIARIWGVVRRHEEGPGMASVVAMGRCPVARTEGSRFWVLLSAASAFAVPGAAKVPANIRIFIIAIFF